MSCLSTELSAKKAPCRVLFPGADGGNRTRVASLGSWSPAIRRHPHYYCCASYCTPDLWIMQAKNACHSVGAYSSVTHHYNSCIRMRKSYWITFAISIHAPHVGRDLTLMDSGDRTDISIYAPHVGRVDSKSAQKFAALLRKVNNFLFREAECRTASAQKPPRCSVIRQIFRCEPISKNVFAAASHLQYQRTLHIVSRLCSKVLDFGLILISEIVKAKAILLAVHYLT